MLEVESLSVSYRSTKKKIIDNISFAVAKKDRIAILGPSGCGKTTLLTTISSLIRHAKIEGQMKWMSASPPLVRVVFQKPTLIPWRNVSDNIAYGLETQKVSKHEMRKRVDEAMELVDLKEFERYLPHQLSLGMQQRVNFARALVCSPDMLLLDEPFSALDIVTKKKIKQQFLDYIKAKEITTILVTHDLEEAISMANVVLVLSKNPARIIKVFKSDTDVEPLKKEISKIMHDE